MGEDKVASISVRQHVRIKCPDSPICVFNNQMGTVVGFTNDRTQINVRPDSAPTDRLLSLFPRELRDTNPFREAPAEIQARIPEFN